MNSFSCSCYCPFPFQAPVYSKHVCLLFRIFLPPTLQLFNYLFFNTCKHHKHSLANFKVERVFLFVGVKLQNIWFSEITIGKECEGYGAKGLIWALRCFVECMLNLGGKFILWILTFVWCFSPSPKHFHINHLIWCYQPTRNIHILKLWKLRWRIAMFVVSVCLFVFRK